MTNLLSCDIFYNLNIVWKYIDGFYQKHKDDSIGVEFDKYDRLFQRGIATYNEMIRLKLDIIEAYNNIH